MLNGLEAVYSS